MTNGLQSQLKINQNKFAYIKFFLYLCNINLKLKNMNPEQMYLANSFLKEKGLSLSEIMKVKNQYSEVYKNEYPYIKSVINKKSES